MSDCREAWEPLTDVGGLDLAALPVVDIQVHPMERVQWSTTCEKLVEDLVNFQLPHPAVPVTEEVVHSIRALASDQVRRSPRQIGYNQYVARVHGVPATEAGIDSVLAPHLVDDAHFSRYTESVLNRERIAAVIVQAPDLDPGKLLNSNSVQAPPGLFPTGRHSWTFSFLTLLNPSWARLQGAHSIRKVVALIDSVMAQAVENGCVGFKSNGAYTRPFGIAHVQEAQAERALQSLLDENGKGPDADNLLRVYEDYLLHHIYVRAGQLGRPILLHVAVAINPRLRIELNDPAPLYDIFRDPEIRAAGTCFVLKNTGYPLHEMVTAMASQFPNVYVDVTFFAQFPASLDQLYRGLLAIAPSEKILYGSDIAFLPEGIAYAASVSRGILANILRDYRRNYGWSSGEIARIAHNILHANAERVFGMKV